MPPKRRSRRRSPRWTPHWTPCSAYPAKPYLGRDPGEVAVRCPALPLLGSRINRDECEPIAQLRLIGTVRLHVAVKLVDCRFLALELPENRPIGRDDLVEHSEPSSFLDLGSPRPPLGLVVPQTSARHTAPLAPI